MAVRGGDDGGHSRGQQGTTPRFGDRGVEGAGKGGDAPGWRVRIAGGGGRGREARGGVGCRSGRGSTRWRCQR